MDYNFAGVSASNCFLKNYRYHPGVGAGISVCHSDRARSGRQRPERREDEVVSNLSSVLD